MPKKPDKKEIIKRVGQAGRKSVRPQMPEGYMPGEVKGKDAKCWFGFVEGELKVIAFNGKVFDYNKKGIKQAGQIGAFYDGEINCLQLPPELFKDPNFGLDVKNVELQRMALFCEDLSKKERPSYTPEVIAYLNMVEDGIEIQQQIANCLGAKESTAVIPQTA